ncbi:hypothetical protein LJR034_004701 [Caballeronia sp. LjRoot34]|uniref:hypothetical protein n=1 Tax=Caballeronia sp. LjRoot34 TaxID=3342325 RepID=UPI003ECC92CF
MDVDTKIQQLQINVAGLYDMLAGTASVTTYLVERILTPEQRVNLAEWLAHQSSETQAPGRFYLAQLGNFLTKEERFEQLLHLAGREFLEQKQADLDAGKPIL